LALANVFAKSKFPLRLGKNLKLSVQSPQVSVFDLRGVSVLNTYGALIVLRTRMIFMINLSIA
jgi:hypothetical protein